MDLRLGTPWFACLETVARPTGGDMTFHEVTVPGREVEIELLHPFSWDAESRGVTSRRMRLEPGQTLTLHAGGYGTADAVAALDGVPFDFAVERDGHRYVMHREPDLHDLHQDTAGWCVARADDQVLVLAWEHAGAVTATLRHDDDQLTVALALPGALSSTPIAGPRTWQHLGGGSIDDGVARLRDLIATFVDPPDLSGMPGAEFPPVVLNSWGCGEDTSTERILALMDGAQRLGVEVFVVDKGWERSVGDWYANDRFAGGLAALSRAARERGMGFGVWCGFGNADPTSPVATQHADWLTQWNGRSPVLSFDNFGLCLGHAPVEEWVTAELHRMVDEYALTWLIHDFETISRCNRADHTHPVEGGEWAAAQAWSRVFASLKAAHPQLVLENCWNGVRPLDLAMVAAHHTTITEDHCTSHWNLIAKHHMGRYLPLDWQSAYMGAERLPDRARLAPYVVGGPWIIMEDVAAWSDATFDLAHTAVQRYKQWRGDWRRGSVVLPGEVDGGITGVEAVGSSGARYRVLQTPPGTSAVTVRLEGRPTTVVDGWTGEVIARGTQDVKVEVDPEGDGLMLLLTDLEPEATASAETGTAIEHEQVPA